MKWNSQFSKRHIQKTEKWNTEVTEDDMVMQKLLQGLTKMQTQTLEIYFTVITKDDYKSSFQIHHTAFLFLRNKNALLLFKE